MKEKQNNLKTQMHTKMQKHMKKRQEMEGGYKAIQEALRCPFNSPWPSSEVDRDFTSLRKLDNESYETTNFQRQETTHYQRQNRHQLHPSVKRGSPDPTH